MHPILADVTVTAIDLYKTLADIIGAGPLPCNEAPDSRSLLGLLAGEETFSDPVLHHSTIKGDLAIRWDQWKLIPGTKELFDLKNDLQELENLYEEYPAVVQKLSEKMDEIVTGVNNRENRTKEGSIPNIC